MSKELNLYSKKISENIMIGGDNSLNNINDLSIKKISEKMY